MKKKNDIPSDIIVDILSGMPVDSVLQWKRVCKTWRSLVDHDPTFVALHTHRFITSSSSSGGGQQLVIKSAPAAAFSFFVMASKYSLYSIDNDEFYFGEYPYNNINNNDAAWKKYSVNPAPLMKLSNKPIPISHRFHHLLNVDNKKCISSCNGLILIAASISHTKDNNNNNNNSDDAAAADMFVFNPVTREYVHLPRPPPPFDKYHHNDDDDGGRGGIGFGYHPITNEYKVVRITSSYSSYGESESDYISSVYTLGSGGGLWRKSKGEIKTNINLGGGDHEGGNNNYNYNNNNNIFHLRWSAHPAVLLNGVLHWLRNDRGYGVILSFDLADEELKILPLSPDQEEEDPFLWEEPDHINHLQLPPEEEEEDRFLWEPDRINHLHLGVLGGCLCLSANNIVQNQSRVDIWVLNKLEEDHNQEEYSTAAASCSWTMKYSLSTGAGAASRLHWKYEIVADLGGGKILFSTFHDGRRLGLGLVSYDPETGYVEELNEKRCFGVSRWNNRWSTINRWSAMIPYVKSFVSLKALGEEEVVG